MTQQINITVSSNFTYLNENISWMMLCVDCIGGCVLLVRVKMVQPLGSPVCTIQEANLWPTKWQDWKQGKEIRAEHSRVSGLLDWAESGDSTYGHKEGGGAGLGLTMIFSILDLSWIMNLWGTWMKIVGTQSICISPH